MYVVCLLYCMFIDIVKKYLIIIITVMNFVLKSIMFRMCHILLKLQVIFCQMKTPTDQNVVESLYTQDDTLRQSQVSYSMISDLYQCSKN